MEKKHKSSRGYILKLKTNNDKPVLYFVFNANDYSLFTND